MPDNSINYVRFRSHGYQGGFGLDYGKESGGSDGVQFDPATGKITLVGNKAKDNKDFVKLLKPKLVEGAEFDIRACDTADTGDFTSQGVVYKNKNITKAISSAFPGSKATGVIGILTAWGTDNWQVDLFWNSETYQNGERFDALPTDPTDLIKCP